MSADRRAPRLGIGVIGAGRVGAVLGAALRREGHALTGAYAVSDASRQRAEELLPGVPLLDVPRIVERSEMLLLAVPDDQLEDLAAGIAATGLAPGGQLVVHTSGRYGVEVLAPLERAGAVTLAMHPAMTFTGTAADLPRLVGCPMAVTARGHFLAIAQALAVEIGARPVTVPEGDRILYHAALAHAANHLVVLVDQSREALVRLGMDDPGGYLRPLLEAALDNALRQGAAALTGPVRRGDAGTVAAHLAALADLDATGGPGHARDTKATYRALARAALARSGLSAEAARRVQDVVDGADADPHAPDPEEDA
ncbi:DUF2520 domain-containing protein [Brachybacterium sp. EF45031]|uniref:Rossmann-like and DUF2520 domain-containing protein n=1 Tax=Brachybacterium sillae TaxID=2810536 RepID=UPI00217EEEB9|nr:Rossmann-like and DUF2520 domain-containing protein [Brachybacterium sillae]MCS6712602.1 DUF2520 domain-containing protein [Brachybacterium sillae]